MNWKSKISILYCTWFATNPQSNLVTANTVIIYIYIYSFGLSSLVRLIIKKNVNENKLIIYGDFKIRL